jgi:hypothetical protein
MTLDYLRGLYNGSRPFIEGFNGALATSVEFVASGSIVYGEGDTNCNAIFTATRLLEVASASAADAAAGTGLRTLLVIGCDADGRLQEETITMNGTTSVVGAKGFKTIYIAVGLTYGTGLANAGIIHVALRKAAGCTNTSGALTAPTPAIVLAAGENMNKQCIWVCPPGRKFEVEKLEVGATTQGVVLLPFIRCAALGAWYNCVRLPIGNTAAAPFEWPMVLDAGDAIRFDALSTTAAGQVNVQIYLKEIFGRT